MQRLDDAHWTEQIDLDRVVDRRVERHGRRRVDHDVAGGQGRTAGVVEAEAVGADVAGDHRQPLGHVLVEAVAEQGSQVFERVVAEDLPLHSLLGRGAAAGSDEQDERAVGHRSEQSLDDGGAEEAG